MSKSLLGICDHVCLTVTTRNLKRYKPLLYDSVFIQVCLWFYIQKSVTLNLLRGSREYMGIYGKAYIGIVFPHPLIRTNELSLNP